MNDESERPINELIDEMSDYRSLIAHPGWKRLAEEAETIVNQLNGQVLQPSRCLDDLIAKEHPLGNMEGMLKLIAIPGIVIAQNEELLEARKQEQNDGEEEQD